MAGQVDALDGGHASNFQHLLPGRSFGQRTPFSTSDSIGTRSSSYSLPQPNQYKGTSTPVSSFESGWSNFPADGQVVSIEQYRTLQARFNEINRENSNLVKECIRLEAKNGVLKEAYEHLLERVPISFGERTVLKREDYPRITFWFRHEYLAALAEDKIASIDDVPVKAPVGEYNEADDEDDDGNGEDGTGINEQSNGSLKGKRGKGRAAQGQNVKMRYLQHENGDIIDGWRASDIRRYARSIFVGFALQGKVFQSWVEGADAASRTSYYHDMAARFPEVSLCELDWKSEQIASEIYSQWRSNWNNKHEPSEKTKGKSSKRLVDESLKEFSSKKMKSATLGSLPTDVSDTAPQITASADIASRPMQVVEQIATESHLPNVNAFPGPLVNTRPQYQFLIDKPFAIAPPSLHPPSSLPTADLMHLAQGSSTPGEHNFNMHRPQGEKESANGIPQKTSKRLNKMRVNKHSITPRNLCAKEWVEQHHGTVDEFAAYFSALPAEELERFRALSKSLSGEKDA
ncbi:hypothetical protein HYPSUDRAFT_199677 [Hypholoma sublateritium FD-334 SS-4]|uniref:Uncharacterized protein n=1 Tax=Hypholoma sublateritium (strain FD-334 SS-4) TaxID=945553 RepID=A0A0D2Q1V0_HYPSF|nr:hypothetical protein HYPSUDRAFT_199677 [Hypholoma sublateritium FD-334 SS-4]